MFFCFILHCSMLRWLIHRKSELLRRLYNHIQRNRS
jgi:hypothetical protein